MSARTLNAQHQPRVQRLPNVGKHSPDRYEGRISRDDEQTLTTEARRKLIADMLERLETKGRVIVAEMHMDRDIASRQAEHELLAGIASFRKARSKIAQTI